MDSQCYHTTTRNDNSRREREKKRLLHFFPRLQAIWRGKRHRYDNWTEIDTGKVRLLKIKKTLKKFDIHETYLKYPPSSSIKGFLKSYMIVCFECLCRLMGNKAYFICDCFLEIYLFVRCCEVKRR